MKRVVSFLLCLVMIINFSVGEKQITYAATLINESAIDEMIEYPIFEMDFLMNQLDIDGENLNGTKDVYNSVMQDDYFYREIYDYYSSNVIFQATTVFEVQVLNDDINLIENPEYFYETILMDILQNKELKAFSDDSLKNNVVSNTTSLVKKVYKETAKSVLDSIGVDSYKALGTIPWKDLSEEMQKSVLSFWKENDSYGKKYKNTMGNLSLFSKMMSVANTLQDGIERYDSLCAVAEYNENTLKILNDIADKTSNQYLKKAIKDIVSMYDSLISPKDLWDKYAASIDAVEYTVEKIGWFAVKTAVDFLFSDILGIPSLVWEVGTTIADLIFDLTDSATCYMSIEASTLIEDELRKCMKSYQEDYNELKSNANALKCKEVYKLTLANSYYATNTVQQLGYSICGNGSLWGFIKSCFGCKDYENFENICASTRNIILSRYYSWCNKAKELYTQIYEISLSASNYEGIELKDFSLNENSVTLNIGESFCVSMVKVPSNATVGLPEYSSTNITVADVDSLGVITACSEGTTTITVSCGEIIRALEVKVVNGGEQDYYSNFEYEKNADGTITIKQYLGSEIKVVVPRMIDGCTVTRLQNDYDWSSHINEEWFIRDEEKGEDYNAPVFGDNIIEIVLPETIKEIGYLTFKNCKSLMKVNIPQSVETIYGSTFYGCKSLKNVIIPENISRFGADIFEGCESLNNITIPGNITKLEGTFKGCKGLSNVILKEGIKHIGLDTFSGCTSLEKIVLPKTVTEIVDPFSSCQKLYEVTLPVSANYVEHYQWNNPKNIKKINLVLGSNGKNEFGDEIDNLWSESREKIERVFLQEGIINIGEGAFYECVNLKNIILPDTIEQIESSAFAQCSLISIDLPNNITKIGSGAFAGCLNFTEIIIPDSVEELENYAFSRCLNLKEITIPISLKLAHKECFDDVLPEKVIFSKGTGEIQDVEYESGRNISVPWDYYKGGENLKEVILEEGIVKIGSRLFCNCIALEKVVLPTSLEEIGEGTFENCRSLSKIDLPDSLKKIGKLAFANCANIVSLEIPDSVSEMGGGQFFGCKSLKNVKLNDNITTLDSVSREDDEKTYELAAMVGEHFYEQILYDNHNYGMFEECSSLESINIPSSVISLGDETFENCKKLISINGLSQIEYIGSGAFYNTSWYEKQDDGLIYIGKCLYENKGYSPYYGKLEIKAGTKSVSPGAFGRNDITDIIIPNSVEIIGSGAFYANNLTNINVPSNVCEIGVGAFGHNNKLKDIVVDSSNQYFTSIDGVLFNKDCTELIQYPSGKTGVVYSIPNTVKTLKGSSFERCSDNLQVVDIPASIKSIEMYALNGNKLHLFYNGTEDEWNEINIVEGSAGIENGIIHFNATSNKNITLEPIIAPTCEYSGKSDLYCSICKKNYEITINSLGHLYKDEIFEASCQDGGYTEHKCSICGEGYIDNYTSALGHDSRLIETVEAKDCGNPGYSVYECKRCGEQYEDDYVYIDHRYIETVIKPTCIKQGYTKHECLICGDQYTDNWTDTLGHNYIDGICSICNKKELVMDVDVPITVNIEAEGDMEYIKFIPKESGTYYFWSDTSEDTYGYLYDSNMNNLTSDDDGGGNGNFCVTYDLEEGNTYYFATKYYSSGSKGKFKVMLSREFSSRHCYETKKINPTCIHSGYTEYTCSLCGDSYRDNYVDALGHDFVDGVCTRCNGLEQDLIESSHPYSNNCDQTWTITKPGARNVAVTFSKETLVEEADYIYIYDSNDILVRECSGDALSGKRILIKGDTVKIRLVSDKSYTEYGFSVVNVETYYGECTHKNTQIINAEEATCGRKGYTGDIECLECGEIIEGGIEIPATGKHDLYSYVTEPTCSEEGYMEYYCEHCDYYKKDNIVPATGKHNFANGICKGCNTLDKDYDIPKMMVGNEYEVQINNSGEKYVLTYIPEKNSTITFYSLGNNDTFGYLYNSDMELLASNDDEGEECNFSIQYKLEAGKTYYFICSLLDSESTGEFSVLVEYSEDEKDESTTETKESEETTIPSNSIDEVKTNKPSEDKATSNNVVPTTKEPKTTKVKSLKKAKKSLKLTWKRVKHVSGYQLQYSTSKKFKKAKKIIIKKAKTTSKTIKKLKAKKIYYVRMRTYIIINGKKNYSKWSKVKKQKTK